MQLTAAKPAIVRPIRTRTAVGDAVEIFMSVSDGFRLELTYVDFQAKAASTFGQEACSTWGSSAQVDYPELSTMQLVERRGLTMR